MDRNARPLVLLVLLLGGVTLLLSALPGASARVAAQQGATPTSVPIPVTFQQGVSPTGYNGCQDTFISQLYDQRDSNYCADSSLEVRTAEEKAALIRFDISSLPTNAVVITAELQLYLEWSSIAAGRTVPVDVYRLNRPWQACAATWFRPLSGPYWGQPGANGVPTDRAATAGATTVVSTGGVWYKWNITTLAQGWVSDPASNYGMLLKSALTGYAAGMGFSSANHGATNLHPKLYLVYSIAPPTATPTQTRTPTITLTPTITPTPTQTPVALILGSVLLQGRPDPPDASWRIPLVFKLLKDAELDTLLEVMTDDAGNFSVGLSQHGVFDLIVKGAHTLANRRSPILITVGVNHVQMGLLLEGDANNDNVVDVTDFSLLRSVFGSPDPRADFNGSGLVDIFDFSLLRSNFGKAGDILLP